MTIEPTRISSDIAVSKRAARPEGKAAAPEASAPDPQESFQATPDPAKATAKVKVFPQDPLVGPTEEIDDRSVAAHYGPHIASRAPETNRERLGNRSLTVKGLGGKHPSLRVT